jgi:Domain of unknown function (DUF1708)
MMVIIFVAWEFRLPLFGSIFLDTDKIAHGQLANSIFNSKTGLDIPFLLLPYRPTSDPSAVRTFMRRFFDDGYGLKGDILAQELRMTEPMVS